MGGVVGQITGGLLGDPAQNNYSGNYDYSQGQINANIGSENQLAKQINTQANSGASPADIMLQQAMNKNLQQQQALIGSQRGINPGLAARQIQNTGANLSQQTAGQMAAQRAQEQMNANQLQSNLYGNVGNQLTNQASTAAGASLGQNQMNEAAASGLESGISSAVMGPFGGGGGKAHGGMVHGYDGGGMVDAMGPLSAFGQQQQPYASSGMMGANINLTPENAAPSSANTGYLGANTSLTNTFNPYKDADKSSGQAQSIAPGSVNPNGSAAATVSANMANIGNAMGGAGNKVMGGMQGMMGGSGGSGGGGMMSMLPMLAALLNKGGEAKPMINGETYAALGKMVPGKAKVSGDHPKNDTVPAMLSPKEIIIPRSIAMAPDAPEKAKKFVEAVLAKNRGKK